MTRQGGNRKNSTAIDVLPSKLAEIEKKMIRLEIHESQSPKRPIDFYSNVQHTFRINYTKIAASIFLDLADKIVIFGIMVNPKCTLR